MSQKFADNARALLTASITAGATSISIEAAKADRYPVANTSNWTTPLDWFKVVLQDASGNREVIKVGTRASGSGVLGNLLRGQDGTTALSWTSGAVAVLAVTAADVQNALAGQLPAGSTVVGTIAQDGVAGRVTPVGGIIMYSGAVAAIPSGWALCNGASGTPDLRDKFIIGAGSDLLGVSQTNITGSQTKSGGNKDLVVPTHTHTATFSGTALAAHGHGVNDPTHAHGYTSPSPAANNAAGGIPDYISVTGGTTSYAATGISIQAASAGTPAGTVAVNNAGVSATDANLPPYYALAFIMCLA